MKTWKSLFLIGCTACFSLTINPIHGAIRSDLITHQNPLIISQQTNQTVITGEQGQYFASILINASSAEVWAVLTDYNNFNQFIPNVTFSQLIESNDNVKIIEQISERILFGLPIQTRMRTQNEEIDRQQINFTLINGDLSKLEGYWKIESVTSANSTGNQVLLTHQVEAQPPAGIPPAIFYDIFKNSLEPTMNAIRQAAENK
jgi:ribosome-associated toxin RatA of RatAB toxin-antitoxin module